MCLVFLSFDKSGYESDLLELCVHNNQATAAVSITDIARLGGGTDVDISLLFYLGGRTGGCSDLVKCLETFFRRKKSRWSTFIADKINVSYFT